MSCIYDDVSVMPFTTMTGLFRQGWDEEATVIRTLKSTLKSYSSDLHARWCGDEKDASRIVSGVVDSTLVCYIDVLVTSNILTMGPSVAKRLTEDLQVYCILYVVILPYIYLFGCTASERSDS